ncbi:MAG: type II secretion system GspH family protein [Acetatifactor sp.]|nr:type II secretion system GspH family protein [Acetatifactor sp.]
MVKQKFREDRRGLTLIELVCAVAILAIISATVGGAMVVATNSYRSGTTEAALQQEAQFTANAIESLIVDATDTVDYTGGVLKIANVDYTYEITYKSAEQKLVYTQYETAAPGNVIASEELIAEHVSAFDVDASAFASARNVQLYITMENENKTFATAYSITSRNNPDAGTPVTVTARINVTTEITLEPNQEYFLNVDVVGPSNKAFRAYLEAEPDHALQVTCDDTDSAGVTIRVGSAETGGSDALVRLWVETVATDSSSHPLDRKCVIINIRRVTGFDFTGFTLRGGTALKAGAEYSITATPTGTNLAKVVGALYEEGAYAYVDPNTLKWRFGITGATGSGNDYAEFVDPLGESSNELIFRLKQDLPAGSTLRVIATAQHPAGENKSHTPYDTVEGYRELVAAMDNPLNPRNGMLRRGDDCDVDADLDPMRLIEEEWKRNHPGEEMPDKDKYNAGFTGNIYFRYKADDGTHASRGYPEWIKMAMQGSDPHNIQFKAADFEDMLFMKDYTLEILYSFKYNTRDNRQVYYPASAFPSGGSVPVAEVDSTYIYTLPMYAFSMQFQSYEDGNYQGGAIGSYLTANGTGIGTFDRPFEIDRGWGQSVKLKFNVFTGANVGKANVIESLMNSTRCYSWNGTSWQSANARLECKERMMPDAGVLQFEPNNGQMQTGVIYKFVMQEVKGETYVDEPIEGRGGRGVIYVKLK